MLSRISRLAVSVSSPVTLTADSEPPNSQVSESDVTTASLSPDFASHSKTVGDVTNTRQTHNTRFGQNCLFYYLFGLL